MPIATRRLGDVADHVRRATDSCLGFFVRCRLPAGGNWWVGEHRHRDYRVGRSRKRRIGRRRRGRPLVVRPVGLPGRTRSVS